MICYVDWPHPFTTTTHFIRLRRRARSNGNAAVVQRLCLGFMQPRWSARLCGTPTQCCCSWLTAAVCQGLLARMSADLIKSVTLKKGRRGWKRRKKLDAGFTSNGGLRLVGVAAGQMDCCQSETWRAARIRPVERSVPRSRQRISDLIASQKFRTVYVQGLSAHCGKCKLQNWVCQAFHLWVAHMAPVHDASWQAAKLDLCCSYLSSCVCSVRITRPRGAFHTWKLSCQYFTLMLMLLYKGWSFFYCAWLRSADKEWHNCNAAV